VVAEREIADRLVKLPGALFEPAHVAGDFGRLDRTVEAFFPPS
jgi:hypothetical protein